MKSAQTTIQQIAELAFKMNIGISRSEKKNTWTTTCVTQLGLTEQVFSGDKVEFLIFLQIRYDACN